MDWQWFYVSLKGRVSRSQYWFYFIIPVFILAIIVTVIGGVSTGFSEDRISWPNLIFGLLVIWPGIAVQVKRWHDRNKSGWWYLINLVPVIGGLWALVECGFLAGTEGENNYGADPRRLSS